MDTRKPALITVEGFDGCGKTTVSRLLAEKLGWIRRKSPGGAFDDARANFDLETVLPEERAWFYMADSAVASMFARRHLNNGESVILDRYFHSTLAYNNLSGPPWTSFVKQLEQPDLVLFIRCDWNVIQSRLKDEDRSTNDKLFDSAEAYDLVVDAYLRQFTDVKMDVIQNDGLLTETVGDVIRALRQRQIIS